MAGEAPPAAETDDEPARVAVAPPAAMTAEEAKKREHALAADTPRAVEPTLAVRQSPATAAAPAGAAEVWHGGMYRRAAMDAAPTTKQPKCERKRAAAAGKVAAAQAADGDDDDANGEAPAVSAAMPLAAVVDGEGSAEPLWKGREEQVEAVQPQASTGAVQKVPKGDRRKAAAAAKAAMAAEAARAAIAVGPAAAVPTEAEAAEVVAYLLRLQAEEAGGPAAGRPPQCLADSWAAGKLSD